MIKDEDVIKSVSTKYMKPHEKVLYYLAFALGIGLIIAGIVLLALGIWIVGLSLLGAGILEIIGVWLLLWTDGDKKSDIKDVPLDEDMFKH